MGYGNCRGLFDVLAYDTPLPVASINPPHRVLLGKVQDAVLQIDNDTSINGSHAMRTYLTLTLQCLRHI